MRAIRASVLAVVSAVVLAVAGLVPASTPASALTTPVTPAAPTDYARACDATPRAGLADCMVLIRTNVAQRRQDTLRPDAAPTGVGYGPSSLQSAYALPSDTAGDGQTVAVVDAYDDPAAESDLAVYRSDWGLPACTTANGCFSKVDQDGQASPLPTASGTSGWATEVSLDLDMVSAICPNCHILLVEANSTDISDLGAGVNAAVAKGVEYVSNSYGSPEYAGEVGDDAAYYDHPGVAVTASAGDDGYGVSFPAASPHVVAVGGTTLSQTSGGRGWTETAWSGTGSGCSIVEPKPAWQTDSGCSFRTDNDVSAVADPDTGVAVYDTYDRQGWLEVGGTSAASPLIASAYALAGVPKATTYPASYIYDHTSDLYDPAAGSDGACYPAYLCTAGPGYDGPTGWGTPDGVAALEAPTGDVITVSDPGSQSATEGVPFSLQLQAGDSATGQTLTYQASELPPGLSVDAATGVISGTPTTAGSFATTVTVTDGTDATGTAVISFTVASPVTFPTLFPQSAYVGQPVRLRVTAADAIAGTTLRYSATGLPRGLSINATTGIVSGTVTAAGYRQPVVTATDSKGWSGSLPVVWQVGGAPAAGRTGPLELNGTCLNAPGLRLTRCDRTAAQRWRLRPNALIEGAGTCLATSGSSVRSAACNAQLPAQQWRLGTRGELVNPSSGKCLTGGRALAPCTAGADQRWSVPAGPLVSAVTGMCAAADGARVELWFCGDTAAQAWVAGGNGTLGVGGTCLTSSGGKVTLARCTASASQRWRITAGGTVVDQATGKCLTDPGADPSDGTLLTAGSCTLSPAVLWHVE